MKKHIRRDDADTREGGFTLVEMVIAISVLAVMILAASGVLNGGVRALAAAKARARANDIATEAIEDLQRFSFNNLGLCDSASGTVPAGLESQVTLPNCAAATFTNPCDPTTVTNTVPKAEYACQRNSITYTVKRYVAWVDALQTTKRLAVYVEWVDLVGRHQVSQQSSLRAPDQSAITGLAPPTLKEAKATPSSTPLTFDGNGWLTSASTLTLYAKSSTLNAPASGALSTSIPAHQRNDRFDIKVANGATFPNYNGFQVTIVSTLNEREAFTVLAGAGTNDWVVVANGTTAFTAGAATVTFSGDKVTAVVRTIGPNNTPQQSIVRLDPRDKNPGNGQTTEWQYVVTTTAPESFRFGEGFQFVRFDLERVADGKTTAAFTQGDPIRLCPHTSCSVLAQPALETPSVPLNIPLGSSGELTADVPVSVTTNNISSSDAVTVSFLTQSGTVTIALQVKPGTTCADSASQLPEVRCHWVGTLSRTDGYRFTKATQSVYFGAQQVVDTVNPTSIDKGSTAAAVVTNVKFGS